MEHYLRFIGYYRLSGYALPLTKKYEEGSHAFKPGASFGQILTLYRFDRELRLLMMDAVERVEVAFRSCLTTHLSLTRGPHWYFESDCFQSPQDRDNFRLKVIEETGYRETGNGKKGHDVFLRHYFSKYSKPELPPAWMIAEVISISCWSRLFRSLRREFRKPVAHDFGLSPETLESWIHAVSYLRNLCAHHSRLWNREFTIQPRAAARDVPGCFTDSRRFYAQAFVVNFLLLKAAPSSSWWLNLTDLLAKYPSVDPAAMGFASPVVVTAHLRQ